jgi:GNAT superfamily N-acetyltransferase
MQPLVTFHVERWGDALEEVQRHWPNHWREVAMHQDEIPLEPDYDEYDRLDGQGALHLTVARCAGEVVGYATAIIRTHLHYKSSLSAFFDLYYVHPSHRNGWVGVNLFKHVESSMRARGVQRLFAGTKVSLDMSRIFQRLGTSSF